jgi:hypothetical protein
MPHRWLDSVIPGSSKLTRLLDVADSGAQALSLATGLFRNSNSQFSVKDLLNSEGVTTVRAISKKILPIQERVLALLQGQSGDDAIEEIRGVEILNLLKASRSLIELGLLAEPLSGCLRPARVLLLFTSDSEFRAVGGLIGQFALLELNCDEFEITKVGTNAELTDNLDFHSMHQEFPGLYFGINDEWVNSNLLPTGELLGQAWISSFESQFDVALDGVLAIDTQILAAIAASKGGITAADGTSLQTKNEVSAYLRNGIYFQYPEDQIARKRHLLEVTNSIAKDLTIDDLANAAMFGEYLDLVIANRLFMTMKRDFGSADVEMLNWDSRNSNDIYIGVNNLSGSKFDFYSDLEVSHRFCPKNKYLLEIILKNVANPGAYYPDYVGRRLDKYPSKLDGVLNQILISLPAKGVDVSGKKISPFSSSALTLGESQNRNLFSITEFISAGEKYTVQLSLRSPERLFFRSWGEPYSSHRKVPQSRCS